MKKVIFFLLILSACQKKDVNDVKDNLSQTEIMNLMSAHGWIKFSSEVYESWAEVYTDECWNDNCIFYKPNKEYFVDVNKQCRYGETDHTGEWYIWENGVNVYDLHYTENWSVNMGNDMWYVQSEKYNLRIISIEANKLVLRFDRTITYVPC
jgi:hypothetical protein